MLGENIGNLSGKIIGTRVLACEGRGPGIEVTIQESGKLLGVEANNIGTYKSHVLPGGGYAGDGQGILTSKDGDTATWHATGVGHPTGKGQAVNWRGALYFSTTSSKLSRLNGTCVIFEHDCDENGNTSSKLSEWR